MTKPQHDDTTAPTWWCVLWGVIALCGTMVLLDSGHWCAAHRCNGMDAGALATSGMMVSTALSSIGVTVWMILSLRRPRRDMPRITRIAGGTKVQLAAIVSAVLLVLSMACCALAWAAVSAHMREQTQGAAQFQQGQGFQLGNVHAYHTWGAAWASVAVVSAFAAVVSCLACGGDVRLSLDCKGKPSCECGGVHWADRTSQGDGAAVVAREGGEAGDEERYMRAVGTAPTQSAEPPAMSALEDAHVDLSGVNSVSP